MGKNKGYVLITDALVALFFGIIIFTTLLAMDSFNIKMEFTEFLELHYVSEDTFDVMNKKGTLDQVGYLWSVSRGNRSSPAWSNMPNITRYHLERLVPPRMGYKMLVDDLEIYNSSWNPNRTLEADSVAKTHASRFLVGYGENLTVLGKTARAYLSKIKGKTTSAYAYFGGFVGQGNLSRELFLPSDAVVQSAYIEVNAGSDFDLYINGAFCKTFNVAPSTMDANVKDAAGSITSCNNSITNKGSIPNIFEINFTNNNISQHYIGGGFIEVTYNTTQMDTDVETGTMRFYLPQIEGIINYYSSFYVPGFVTAMKSNITFRNNFTTFFTVGNTTIFRVNGSSTKRSVYNGSLTSILASSAVSEKTVPIRIGTGDISYTITSGYGDIILITDLSGSMGGSKINDAKAADKEFVSIILNTTGNRVGLVSYGNRPNEHSQEAMDRWTACCSGDDDWSCTGGWICEPYHPYNDTNDTSCRKPNRYQDTSGNGHADAHIDVNLTDNGILLNNSINGYSAHGGTCIVCAIHGAVNALLDHGDPSHRWSVVLMTDGKSTMAAMDPNASDNHSMEAYMPSDWGTGGDYSPTGKLAAVEAAREAYERYNVILYAVGFQTDAQGAADLQEIAVAGNGTYYSAGSADDLKEIYRNISRQIVNASYYSQTVVVSGENMTNSTLYGYPESYIEFTYTPHNVSEYGKISITKKSERFNEPVRCVGNLSIPGNVTVSSMKVTSYSGDHWTHYLNISNSKPFAEPYKLWEAYPGVPYIYLGDPYIVHVNQPWNLISPGEYNLLGIRTGNSPTNDTHCSADDRAIYTVRVSSILGYGDVLPTNEGCLWNIEFSSGSTVVNLSIPSYYTGTRKCSYTSSNQSYDGSDAAADAVFRLLRELDIEDDGVVDIDFDSDALQFDTSAAGKVRSLWGPIKMILVIWS